MPEPGDYVTIEIGAYSLIIVRDDDEEVRALHNVCRHRGSRLLEDPCGSVGNLVCPYHQWTYRTDGSLIFAEGQSPSFDKSQFGLKQVHVRTRRRPDLHLPGRGAAGRTSTRWLRSSSPT